VGEPNHGVAEQPELDVPRAIRLERPAPTVEPVAIGLDDQPLVSPEEVDEEGTDPDVYLRGRNPMPSAEAQEPTLGLATGQVGLEAIVNRQPQVLRLPQCGRELRGTEQRCRSSNVRTGFVTGIASLSVQSLGRRVVERWRRMPGLLSRPPCPGMVMSIGPSG